MVLVIYTRDFIHIRSVRFNSFASFVWRRHLTLGRLSSCSAAASQWHFQLLSCECPHQISTLAKLTDMYSIVMPDSPMEAKFLKGDDKLIAIERLRANQMGVASRVWKWDHLLESFLDMKTWFWFAMIFSIS